MDQLSLSGNSRPILGSLTASQRTLVLMEKSWERAACEKENENKKAVRRRTEAFERYLFIV